MLENTPKYTTILLIYNFSGQHYLSVLHVYALLK